MLEDTLEVFMKRILLALACLSLLALAACDPLDDPDYGGIGSSLRCMWTGDCH